MAGRTHLVIPDSHAHPDYNNDRYEWLGKYILDLRPDVIVNIGDHADMPSLCSYDRGKKAFEGRRYKKDVECVRDSLRRLHAPIDAYNKRRRRNKKSIYSPRWVITLGNHEHRIRRACDESPELDGVISVNDLGFEDYGYEVYEYLRPASIDGVFYCHSFVSGVMGRPIGGENHARSLITKQHLSCTVGHSHLRDFAERIRPDGSRIQGLVVGCYFDFDSAFAGCQVNSLYWRGVVVCRDVCAGEYDHEWISLASLRNKYGTTNKTRKFKKGP